jgi:hypothetical protein
MKQILVIAGLGLALTGCMTDYGWSEAPLDDRHYADGVPVDWWGRDVGSVDIFTSALAPYGTWGNHSRYGRVFLPTGVGPGWQPYARGYWRNDPRFGRMFVSQDPWGWATYHYGRWGRDSRFGWFWVPDTRFGPNWVDWQSAGGFASWSPLPPPGWSRWGYGWGNDWWVHAPGAWAYRPGMTSHVRRGRWDGHRDRDWDRDGQLERDRDSERVDRTRPGESPMAGFVRNRVPAPDTAAPRAARPDRRWDERPNPEGMFAAPRREARPSQGGGDAVGGFVRNRVQADGAPALRREPSAAMVAPPRAVPAASRPAPERPSYSPPPRAERPAADYSRSREPQGRDVQQRVADD